VRTVRKN